MVFADERFVDTFAEVVVRSPETAVKNASQSSLRIAAVGTQMLISIFSDETQQIQLPGDHTHKESCQPCRKIVGHIVDTVSTFPP